MVLSIERQIAAAKELGLIKPDVTDIGSTRYARYLPFWA
jgi:hypothetical protein